MPFPPAPFDADHVANVDVIRAADVNAIEEAVNETVAEVVAHGTAIAGKAATAHAHAEGDVTGLIGDLAAKETPAGAQAKADAAAVAAIAAAAALVDDLSGVTNPSQARTNLGLGTAAVASTSAFDAAGAAAAAAAASVPLAQKGAAGGVATLDGSGLVPTTQLPGLAITSTSVANSQAAMLALAAQEGDVAVRTDLSKTFILDGSDPTVLGNWQELLTPTDTVTSVEGRTGAVTLADLYDTVGAAAAALASANASAVQKSLYDANTVLAAATDNTPAALAMGASTILARLASGGIVAATPSQLRTLLSLVVGTDVQAWDADLDTVAAIGGARRMLRVNAAGTGLEYVDPRSFVIADAHTDTTVVNTTNETTFASLSLPGGLVAAGDVVRLSALGDFLNNSGAGVTYLHKVKLGATTVLASAAISFGSNGSRRHWTLDVDVLVESVTAQRIRAVYLPTANTAAGGWPLQSTAGSLVGYGTAAVDLASSADFIGTITMGSAASTADFVCHGAWLSVLKQ